MKATSWPDDEETFRLLKEELLTAVVGCILEVRGYCRQLLPTAVDPQWHAMKIAECAMPTLEVGISDDGRSKSTGSPACKAFNPVRSGGPWKLWPFSA
jgi:hypothetical protein